MRIWHEDLIPYLCRSHLLGMWRESLGCLSIFEENKKGYRNHPQTKEFEFHTDILKKRLLMIRKEMLIRGYHPKELPFDNVSVTSVSTYKRWQTLEEQIENIKNKGCKCNLPVD